MPSLVGPLLLREYRDANYSFELVSENAGGQQVTILKSYSVASQSDRTVTQQTWYFDSGSGLALRIEYRFSDPNDAGKFGTTSVDLYNYKPISNVLYPFQIVMSQNGVKMADVSVQSIINSNLPPEEFDSPRSSSSGEG